MGRVAFFPEPPKNDMVKHEVFNDDIAGIYHRINKYIVECQKSASANVAAVNEFDKARMSSYLTTISSYIDWVVAEPALDLPETHPQLVELKPKPEILDIENLMIQDCVRLWERGRDEVTASQSARNPTGLIKFDEARLRAVILKTEKYMSDYIEKVSPIDLPESSPTSPEQ